MTRSTRIIVMGVSGCGKSTLGQSLALALGCSFVEGDSEHSAANVAKMRSGQPLNDDDRADWLKRLAYKLATARAAGQSVVVSCSALKRKYRDTLRTGDAQTLFVYLHGNRLLIDQRMQARQNHYMPASLLDSQFAALEIPAADENVLQLDVAHSPEQLLQQVLNHL